MDDGLLETAASNFEDAGMRLTGSAQIQRIALGLKQIARAAKTGSRNAALLETAATNFEDAGMRLTGPAQIQRIALGLKQLARGLKR
jgi:hypothetical protein